MSTERAFSVDGVNLPGSQTVLVSITGRCFHLPHALDDRPVCPQTVGDGDEWCEKRVGVVAGSRPLCRDCRRALDEVPSLVGLEMADD